MKVEGSHTIRAPRELVWNLLVDPEVLMRCVPGVQTLETVAANSFKVGLKVGVGSIKGMYHGTISLDEIRGPEHYRMQVDARGSAGFVKGVGTIDLAQENDRTAVAYAGDVNVGGTIAGVGQRMILSTAKLMAGHFFTALEAEALAIVRAEESGEPVMNPRQGFFRNTVRAFRNKVIE